MKRRRAHDYFAEQWFHHHGWQSFPFQREVWQAVAEGGSGLLHATTGSGKTYAVWLAALNPVRSPTESAASSRHQARTPTRLARTSPHRVVDHSHARPGC